MEHYDKYNFLKPKDLQNKFLSNSKKNVNFSRRILSDNKNITNFENNSKNEKNENFGNFEIKGNLGNRENLEDLVICEENNLFEKYLKICNLCFENEKMKCNLKKKNINFSKNPDFFKNDRILELTKILENFQNFVNNYDIKIKNHNLKILEKKIQNLKNENFELIKKCKNNKIIISKVIKKKILIDNSEKFSKIENSEKKNLILKIKALEILLKEKNVLIQNLQFQIL